MDHYGWQLTAPAHLAACTVALIESGCTRNFKKALIGAYCVIMHQAFMGEQGPDMQRRACEELGQVLLAMLLREHPGVPSDERTDVVQNAIERVWRARASCREPIAFLAFAAGHLLNAVQLSRRQLRRFGEPILAQAEIDDDRTIDIPDPAPSPDDQALNRERLASCTAFIDELRQRRPRAKGQIEVLSLRLLEDLTYDEIAARLAISPDIAYTRLSRIITTIRSDPDLLRRALELGLN